MKERAALAAQSIGVRRHSTKTCFSIGNNKSRLYMEKWVPLVREMTWNNAAGHFSPEWTSQWDIGEDELVPDNNLSPYEKHKMGGRKIFLLKFNADTSTSGRKSDTKAVRDTVVLKTNSFKLQRNDVGKGRKYQLKERFVQSMVKGCWDCVDPVGKLDMYQDLMALDGCAEGKYSYNSYLDPHKDLAASGFANCTKGFLNRFGWSMRENSIVQTVPKHWRKISEVNSVALSKLFRDAKVE